MKEISRDHSARNPQTPREPVTWHTPLEGLSQRVGARRSKFSAENYATPERRVPRHREPPSS